MIGLVLDAKYGFGFVMNQNHINPYSKKYGFGFGVVCMVSV